jgi:subfamily B ATP-binding cassette protein MsbA
MNDARRILRAMRPEWPIFALSMLATLLYVALNSASIWVLGSVVNTIFAPANGGGGLLTGAGDLVGGGAGASLNAQMKAWSARWLVLETPLASLVRVAWVLFFTFLLKDVALYLKNTAIAWMQTRLLARLRIQLFDHLLALPMGFYDQRQTGELASVVINDVAKIRASLTGSLQRLMTEPFNVAAFIGLLFVINWRLTLLAVLMLPVSALLIHWMGKSIKRKSRRTSRQIAGLMGVLQEALTSMRVIQAFTMERAESERFAGESNRFARLLFRQARLANLASPATEMIGVGVGALLLWYGGREVRSGEGMAADDFVRYLFLLFSVMQPVRYLARVNTQIQDGLAGARRVFEVLDAEPEIRDREDAVELDRFQREIRFDGVGLTYTDSDAPALRRIDLVIPRGATVALVGGSGAGKSSLVDLIPRFYDPTEGAVRIDGQDLRGVRLQSLRGLVGVVPQETVLFDLTVAENIRYGRPAASDQEVRGAAAAANALHFVEALPQGFATRIGERGVRLSGGQRQRIAIARAILKNPPILILDEATSSLDTESEREVQEAIDRLVRERTVVVIAHRLSTILHADEIVVLDSGRLAERGRHEELLALDGIYRRLYELQFRRKGERA